MPPDLLSAILHFYSYICFYMKPAYRHIGKSAASRISDHIHESEYGLIHGTGDVIV